MKSKKKNKRKNSKYPGLDPQVNLKIRREEIEVDYLNKLSPKEKAWLNKFNEEYVSASFDPSPSKRLHKTKALKKECERRNYTRNVDILGKAKVNHLLENESKAYKVIESERGTSNTEYEQELIRLIDLQNEINSFEKNKKPFYKPKKETKS